jgi:hypothetical protein
VGAGDLRVLALGEAMVKYHPFEIVILTS